MTEIYSTAMHYHPPTVQFKIKQFSFWVSSPEPINCGPLINQLYHFKRISFRFVSLQSTPQAAKVHNSASTVGRERETNEESVPQTYDPNQLRRIQETVWFEESPPRRASTSAQPRVASSSKSPSGGCPLGCWPLLHLNGLNPGARGLLHLPWQLRPPTASPAPTTSTSTGPTKLYLRL